MPESGWEEMGFSADDGSEKRSALSAWSGQAADDSCGGRRRQCGIYEGHVVEHKGVPFTVVQSIRRGYWVWTVHSDPPRSGEAVGKDWAIRQARKSIDVGLQKQKVLATLRATNES